MSARPRHSDLILWTLVGFVAAASFPWTFPRAFPLFPEDWRLHRGEAVDLALGHLRALGEDVENPYVVAGLDIDPGLELHLHEIPGQDLEPRERSILRDSPPASRRILTWQVIVYPTGTPTRTPTAWMRITPGGEVVSLWTWVPPDVAAAGGEEPEIDPAAARVQADELLGRLGLPPERFGEPELRRIEWHGRTDLVLRYPDVRQPLGAGHDGGVEVTFAAGRPALVEPWLEEAGQAVEELPPWPEGLLWRLHVWAPFLLFPFAAVSFLRRYHEGEAGPRRVLGILLPLTASAALMLSLGAGWTHAQEPWTPGATERQATWFWGVQMLLIWCAPVALTAALAGAVGEARCRDAWGPKLAAFDAVTRGRFASVTVARAALTGPAAGLALAAVLLAVLPGLPALGLQALACRLFDPLTSGSPWPGLSHLALTLLMGGFTVMAQFFLLAGMVPRLGAVGGGVLVTVLSALLFFPPLALHPPELDLLAGAATAAVVVTLLLTRGLLTALLAHLTVHLTFGCLPWLFTGEGFLELHGALPLALLAVPLLLSLRGLRSGLDAIYCWDDVPPHARRIAERERRRLELETARGIQRSILSPLPPWVNGVELAHVYLPAHEVGGDFYDVTPLADGRLALALGDVAGHGVGSGLVMAMARSALAVQVGIDPAVEAVFRALNRTLHHTARKSLLASLCYGVLDPRRGELTFASAGHLCPYLVRPGDGVRYLESPAYPLGVREHLEMHPRRVSVAPGDLLFLCSDGVVEARGQDGGEVFGFARLEAALTRSANGSAEGLEAGVLEELAGFTGGAGREDDQTLLVLRLTSGRSP